MKLKPYSLAAIAATFISLILNTIYYTATAAGHVWAMTKAEPDFALLTLNHVVFALLLAYIYPIGYQGGSPVGEGFRFGVLMGLVMFVPTGLIVRAAWEVPITFYFLIDIVVAAVVTGLMGVAIGIIYNRQAVTAG
ncbi:MAG: hypothetical protein AAF485_03640 [Chloroflexota bacterium]